MHFVAFVKLIKSALNSALDDGFLICNDTFYTDAKQLTKH